MEIKSNIDANALDSFFRYRSPDQEIKSLIQAYAQPYRELMSYYRCAMMDVSTKFNVLNEELSLQYDRNPIETIKKGSSPWTASLKSSGVKITLLI